MFHSYIIYIQYIYILVYQRLIRILYARQLTWPGVPKPQHPQDALRSAYAGERVNGAGPAIGWMNFQMGTFGE